MLNMYFLSCTEGYRYNKIKLIYAFCIKEYTLYNNSKTRHFPSKVVIAIRAPFSFLFAAIFFYISRHFLSYIYRHFLLHLPPFYFIFYPGQIGGKPSRKVFHEAFTPSPFTPPPPPPVRPPPLSTPFSIPPPYTPPPPTMTGKNFRKRGITKEEENSHSKEKPDLCTTQDWIPVF